MIEKPTHSREYTPGRIKEIVDRMATLGLRGWQASITALRTKLKKRLDSFPVVLRKSKSAQKAIVARDDLRIWR
ncbi:MAG: hypothetical protein WA177_23765 [Xanthobacteraceae bacterium]